MTDELEKKLKDLNPEIARKLDTIIKAKHYKRARIWVEELERHGFRVEYYKEELKGKYDNLRGDV